MSDILTFFGVLVILGLGFPALLFVVWLSLPAQVERARQAIHNGSWRCFGVGLLTLLLMALPVVFLLQIPGPGEFTGAALLLSLIAVSTIGAAGMTAHLADCITARAQGTVAAHRAFLYGAVTLELAVAFPVLGWIIVFPFTLLAGLGATLLAFFRRPKAAPQPAPQLVTE
ncbi:hypothetical protein GC175_06215 [bacterium]|nr:hypothetical protein [bacterium]